MKSVEIAEANDSLCAYIQQLDREPLLVSIKGTPVAILAPICDLKALPIATRPEAVTLIKKSRVRQRSDAQASLADYVKNLGREPAIVGFEGKPVAVLVAIADIESVSLSHNPKFQKIVETSRQQQKSGSTISSAEVRKKLGLI
jgi:antitoxin (DNA-binding transcriptional repressor) of toxin-antitoxin stability system